MFGVQIFLHVEIDAISALLLASNTLLINYLFIHMNKCIVSRQDNYHTGIKKSKKVVIHKVNVVVDTLI